VFPDVWWTSDLDWQRCGSGTSRTRECSPPPCWFPARARNRRSRPIANAQVCDPGGQRDLCLPSFPSSWRESDPVVASGVPVTRAKTSSRALLISALRRSRTPGTETDLHVVLAWKSALRSPNSWVRRTLRWTSILVSPGTRRNNRVPSWFAFRSAGEQLSRLQLRLQDVRPES